MKRTLIVILLFLFCPSCKNTSSAKHTLEQWINKEIIFPATLKATYYGRDTVATNYLNKKHKIVIHVDSSGCSECKLGLYKWQKFMNEYEQYENKLEFIFVAHVVNFRQMAIICRQNKFKHILYYDIKGEMNKINNFIENPIFRCFLVDENNKIILIGNPFYNKEIMKIYKEKLDAITKNSSD